MSIPQTVADFIQQKEVKFTIVTHPRSQTSLESAHSAGVSDEKVAKGVLLSERDEFLLAVLPATSELELTTLEIEMDSPLMVTPEENLRKAFSDCAPGAVPALGAAYGIRTVVDNSLADMDDVYFEAGDHRELIHVSGEDFRRLQPDAKFTSFSHPRH